MPGFIIVGDEGSLGPQSLVETARSHRWEVTIDDAPREAADELRFYAQSVTRPNFEGDRITIHRRQNEMYLPGKTRAGTVTIVLYERVKDGGGMGATDVVRRWWSEWVQDTTNHSLNMNDWKRKVRLSLLDGCGTPVWVYLLSGAFPTKVDGSQLDYSSTDLSTVSVTLSVDAYQEGADL